MYTALTYTLFFAAMRAVILVGASFAAIVKLHNCKNGKNEENMRNETGKYNCLQNA